MVTAIDKAIERLEKSHERVIAAAKKRYGKYERLAQMATTPAKKKAAERNMANVVTTLNAYLAKHAQTLTKFKK
jgi:antitoxin component of MazEF toxin-antitoxin module